METNRHGVEIKYDRGLLATADWMRDRRTTQSAPCPHLYFQVLAGPLGALYRQFAYSRSRLIEKVDMWILRRTSVFGKATGLSRIQRAAYCIPSSSRLYTAEVSAGFCKLQIGVKVVGRGVGVVIHCVKILRLVANCPLVPLALSPVFSCCVCCTARLSFLIIKESATAASPDLLGASKQLPLLFTLGLRARFLAESRSPPIPQQHPHPHPELLPLSAKLKVDIPPLLVSLRRPSDHLLGFVTIPVPCHWLLGRVIGPKLCLLQVKLQP